MSTDLTFDDPCILFALRRESAPFYREFRPQERFAGAPCRARFCGPAWLSVLVLETGIGAPAAEATLRWLQQKPPHGNVPYRPKLVLAAGFSGALHDDWKVGDVILATEVVDLVGNRWPTTWPGELPAGEWRPPLHRARLLTVPQLVAKTEDKRDLGRKHEAAAVDMETAVVARWCSQQGIPFGCVRAISDSLQTPLSPQLIHVLSGPRVAPLRLLAAIFRSPRLALDLRRLARDTRTAAKQLGTAVGELLTLTLPGGAAL